MPDLTTVFADRASFGSSVGSPPTSPLRLGTLAAFVAGQSRLAVDASGNVTAGALVASEIPSAFTRRDTVETIAQPWVWSGAGLGYAPPALSTRSVGTRIVLDPRVGTTEIAIGVDTGGVGLWSSVPAGSTGFAWYAAATDVMRLNAAGTLTLGNGTGLLYLNAAGSSVGEVRGNGTLTLASASGGIIFNTSAGTILPSSGYRENLGSLPKKYLSLHAAELWVETLVAQQTLATIGGRVLVGPTTTLTRDVAPGDTTIYVKHNSLKLHVAGVELGSKLVLEANGKFEVMVVSSTTPPTATASGDYPYLVSRGFGGTAAAWYAGDAVFDTGKQTAPAGAFIDLYSVQGVRAGSTEGPTIVGNVRVGQNATDWREAWAVGNLKGIYGNSSTIFGAAFGDYAAPHVQIDSTNGIRFLTANNATQNAAIDMSGNVTIGEPSKSQLIYVPADGSLRTRYNGVDYLLLLSDGNLYLRTGIVAGAHAGTVGVVRSASATAYNAGSGFFFDYTYATGLATALIGNSVGRRVQWNGSSLKVISDGFTLDESGIVLAQGTSGEVAKQVRWSSGAMMYDNATTGFSLSRASGTITIESPLSTGGKVVIKAGGGSVDYVDLQFLSVPGGPSRASLGGTAGGGQYPVFEPAQDNVSDLGNFTGPKRWRRLYSIYGQFGVFPSVPSYQLEVSSDSAGKPSTGTWSIVPSDRRAKRDIEPVDVDAALATVCRVPLIRFTYNGRFNSPDGERAIGVVADDVAELLPLSVKPAGPDAVLAFNPHELLMLNVAAVQALARRVDALTPKG